MLFGISNDVKITAHHPHLSRRANAVSEREPSWGTRLADKVRRAVDGGRWQEADDLVTRGDGDTRNLATEYTFMLRGLGFTIRCLVPLLEQSPVGHSPTAAPELTALITNLHGTLGEPRDETGGHGRLDERLTVRIARAEADQARLADAVKDAIDAEDTPRSLSLLDAKEAAYLDLHDHLVRFMAEAFAWVLRNGGPTELLQFHLATAEAQRVGFEKWEELDASEFAKVTAFLLKQHMGRVTVTEDDQRFTIQQAPCGSGGRLRSNGAYRGEGALPFVTEAGPLTFGKTEMPVYCSHCAIWNGTATLRWFGRAQWVFEDPARSDGSCTLHIYKDPVFTPAEYTALVGVPDEGGGE